MSFAVALISHGTGSLDLLERVAYRPEEIPGALARLTSAEGITGAAILATCNRTEAYASFDRPPEPDRLAQFLALDRGIDLGELRPALSTAMGLDAAGHLFRVAAGLDSMVVGESEIQGQVKAAFRISHEAGTLGTELESLFSRAIAVGRRVRNETVLGADRSIGRRAIDVGSKSLGGLRGRNVLVVGAGKVGRAVVKRLRKEETLVTLSSRTKDRAERLAAASAAVLPLPELRRGMAEADLVICCTAAPHQLIGVEDIDQVMVARHERPLLIIDLSVPRAVAWQARQRGNVQLIDLEDLGQTGIQEAPQLQRAVERGIAIVNGERERFQAWLEKRQGHQRRVAAGAAAAAGALVRSQSRL